MTVKNHRLPFQLGACHVLCFDHVVHVAVAIIVVPDVLLIKLGHGADFVRRTEVLLVPMRDHVLAVGIDGEPKHEDDVVEDAGRFLRRNQLVSEID